MLEVTDMELDVAFLPAGDPTDVAVVIDVLRMTTTAAALLAGGMRRLTIVAETDAALAHAASSGALLFGERMGLPYPGFDGGNSPVEHAKRDYGGRSAILCTTNGSKAVGLVAGARHVLLGAIVNAPPSRASPRGWLASASPSSAPARTVRSRSTTCSEPAVSRRRSRGSAASSRRTPLGSPWPWPPTERVWAPRWPPRVTRIR